MLVSKHESHIAILLLDVEDAEAISRIRLNLGRLVLFHIHANQSSYFIKVTKDAYEVAVGHEDDFPSNCGLNFLMSRHCASAQLGTPQLSYHWPNTPTDPEANNNSDSVGFFSDAYANVDCLPREQKWTTLMAFGSGRSLSALKAYETYCRVLGQSAALEVAGNE
ncbi:hypothetical protein FVE85_8874 [Porphyridium purpureum]|uniref:Uncharacterized protein n=1 Tax=Porphyridium purpureum TaxID=35688 RepID=A0A5J4YPR1_PORPP|nr:hypothetical protein FVE85_8874 [Porphyridium purpureum]|eukprot:POR9494..scf296_7